MDELHLIAGDDHVERLAHENDPVRAVVELVWDAIDAEATQVSVTIEHDDVLGGIRKTTVADDGQGSAAMSWTRPSGESVARGSDSRRRRRTPRARVGGLMTSQKGSA